MNSFRIGVIGVMVEHWGTSMAEGFLHDFEGWAIFMACFGILFMEMWLLMRLTNDRRKLSEVFGIDPPQPADPDIATRPRVVPRSAIATVALVVITLVPAYALPNREEIVPARTMFSSFPLSVDDWEGRADKLEKIYLDALKLSDYSLVNYRDQSGHTVNFYSAYYDSQKKGQSAHSPKSCLPGGGWVIESLTNTDLGIPLESGESLKVNRALITHGEAHQLVYYWFQQRGRTITNEYLVKWFVFWDALTKNRTDGALVRLITPVAEGEDIQTSEAALRSFAASIAPHLDEYIPN